MELFIPPIILCTDNAAMIAALGEIMLKNGRSDSLDLNAVSRWPLVALFRLKACEGEGEKCI